METWLFFLARKEVLGMDNKNVVYSSVPDFPTDNIPVVVAARLMINM